MSDTPEQYYEKLRKQAREGKAESRRGLDRVIFVISTGTFILSINLLIAMANLKVHIYRQELLFLSWKFLLISIIVHSIAYFFAEESCDNVIKRLDKWRENGFRPRHFEPHPGGKRNFYNILINSLNHFTLISLIFGIVILTIFVIINFNILNSI